MAHTELLQLVAGEIATGLGLTSVEVSPGWDAHCIVSASASVFGMLASVKVELALHGMDGPLRYTWEACTGEALTLALPSIRAALCDSEHASKTLAALERIAAAWHR
jgi:hypothetical protein